MLESGGDGGLALEMEMKQFISLDTVPFDTEKEAQKAAEFFKTICRCETTIGVGANGKFIVWYRT